MEQISIDEAFVDISELSAPAPDVARRLQARINSELKLPCSIGVAGNKLTAKIATEVGKKGGSRAQAIPMPSPSSRPDRRRPSWPRCRSRCCGAWGPRRRTIG